MKITRISLALMITLLALQPVKASTTTKTIDNSLYAVVTGITAFGLNYGLKKYNETRIAKDISRAQEVLKSNNKFLDKELPALKHRAIELETIYKRLNFANSEMPLQQAPTIQLDNLDFFTNTIDYKNRWFRTLYNFLYRAVASTDPKAQETIALINEYNSKYENSSDDIQRLQSLFGVHNKFCALYNRYRKSLELFIVGKAESSKVAHQLVYDYITSTNADTEYPYVKAAKDLSSLIYGLENVLAPHYHHNEKIMRALEHFKDMKYVLKQSAEYAKQLNAYKEEQYRKKIVQLQQEQLAIQEENRRLQQRLLLQHAFCGYCTHTHTSCTSQCCNGC